jgi:hypothetical protein
MAQRRMFSKRITNSGRFLKMPTTSQALYFHLNMHADDDGVVEAFQVMRMTGFNEDDLKVLAAKGFIKVLNEDLVTFVMDWREHNLIRPDRKIDSIYKNLLLQIVPEAEILDPRPRADTKQLPGGRPVDKQRTAQVRIGKVRKEKDTPKSSNASVAGKELNEIIPLFEPLNPAYERFFSNTTEKAALARLIKLQGKERLIALLEVLPRIVVRPYAPRITSPYQLEKKFGELKTFINQEKNKSQKTWTVI